MQSQPPGMRSVSRYEVYTGIRQKTQLVSIVCVYIIYSVTNTERATWSWFGIFGAGIAGGSLTVQYSTVLFGSSSDL